MNKKTTLILSLAIFSISVLRAVTIVPERLPERPPVTITDNPTIIAWSLEMRLLWQWESQVSDMVTVYPNPADRKDLLQVSLPGNGLKYVAFYDITGKLVFQTDTEKEQLSLSLADLDPGVYLLNVKSGKLQTTKKVIVR